MSHGSTLEQCGPTQRRILECLLQDPDGLTVESFVDSLSITPSAVRQHLTGLERDGLVTRGARKPTGGRPEQLYVLTQKGREVFPRRYRELAESMLEAVAESVGPQKLETLLRRMGKRLAQQVIGESGETLSLAETAAAMKDAGYEASVARGSSEIVARNCVFHRSAERFPAICKFDLAFLEAMTGDKPQHVECMVRGGQTCRFAFSKAKPS